MKKFRFLLLDAGPIIKLFSLGIWDDFIKHCDISISRIIAYNEALYTEDGAVFRVLGLLGKSNQGISLQEILQRIGLSISEKLEWEYTKAFCEKWSRKGQIDSIQDAVTARWLHDFTDSHSSSRMPNNIQHKHIIAGIG